MIKQILTTILLASAMNANAATDYAKGVLIVNENSYGSPGTITHLQPDLRTGFYEYKVFQNANPGKMLGSTCDFGAYNNSLFIVSKQAKAQSADAVGGILTVMNPHTLKWEWQLDNLDPSGARAEGRGFLGINEKKAYVSSSNGIWIIDLENHKVTDQIAGTENPNGVDDKPVSDGTSCIYHGQTGMMVMAAGKVFAAHQQFGVQIIDPESDRLLQTISMDFVANGAAIGSIITDKNGMLWLSVAESEASFAPSLSVLVQLDPTTLDTRIIRLPEGVFGPTTSWDSWKPDNFCSSATEPYLFWTGAEQTFYAGDIIYRYNIETGETKQIINFNEETGVDIPWKLYGCSMRVNPADGTLFMGLFQDFSSTNYAVRTYTSSGELLRTYPMDKGYWFPGVFLFPESQLSGVETVEYATIAEPDVAIDGQTVRISGTAAGAPISVVNISGQTVARATADQAGTAEIRNLASGIYIVVANGAAMRFAIR